MDVGSVVDLASGPRSRLGKREQEKKSRKQNQPGSPARGSAQLPQAVRQQPTREREKEKEEKNACHCVPNSGSGESVACLKSSINMSRALTSADRTMQADGENTQRGEAVEEGRGRRVGGINAGKQTLRPVFLSVLFPSQLDLHPARLQESKWGFKGKTQKQKPYQTATSIKTRCRVRCRGTTLNKSVTFLNHKNTWSCAVLPGQQR